MSNVIKLVDVAALSGIILVKMSKFKKQIGNNPRRNRLTPGQGTRP